MTNPQPPLKALAGFRAAAQHLSFQNAARELGLTPSAISHQVAQIEAFFGAPVFSRGTRTIALTPLGAKTMKAANRLFSDLNKLRAAASPRRVLTVSALPLFTQAWLMPRIARFHAMHADIEIDISTENKVANLAAGDADIGIRNLRAKPTGVFARKLFDIRGVPVCAPALKGGRIRLERPEDLSRHTLIQYSSRTDAWDRWFAAQGLAGLQPRKVLTVDSVPSALEAAAQGAGVALGLDPLMWAADVAKGLVPALDLKPVPESAYYVCTTRLRARDPSVAAFIGWLFREIAKR